jgi:hypothetical protein
LVAKSDWRMISTSIQVNFDALNCQIFCSEFSFSFLSRLFLCVVYSCMYLNRAGRRFEQ